MLGPSTNALAASLTDDVCSTLVKYVLHERDIGVHAAKNMFSIISQAQESVKPETASLGLPGWLRLCAVRQLLHPDLNLGSMHALVMPDCLCAAARVTQLFQTGELDSLQVEEVHHMVKALFESSTKRQACLAALVEQ